MYFDYCEWATEQLVAVLLLMAAARASPCTVAIYVFAKSCYPEMAKHRRLRLGGYRLNSSSHNAYLTYRTIIIHTKLKEYLNFT